MTDTIAGVARLKEARAPLPTPDATVALRTMTVDDVTDGYVAGMQDPEVTAHLGAVREQPQDRETVVAYVRGNERAATDLLLGVHVDGELAGTVRLHDIEPEARTAIVGIALFDRRVWGRGVGRSALQGATATARDLGLERLVAGILVDNVGSQRAFAAAGFTCVATTDGAQRWELDLAASAP